MLTYFQLFTVAEYMINLGNFLKYTFTTVLVIDIIIALVMLPFILRLSGQLLIQVLKYRLTIRSTDDPTEYIPYYEHHRLFFCILLGVMCFSVVNFIKAFYLLKGLFLYVIEPITLSIVLSFWSAFQDAIISFGLISMVQVMYYLKNKKFNFLRYLSLIILRFVWVLLLESGVFINLGLSYSNGNEISGIFISPLIQFDSMIRFILIFRIAKEANDLVKMRINSLFNNPDVIRLMGHERAKNMYRASVVFRVLSWGNFLLAFLSFVASSLQFISIYFTFYTRQMYNYSVLLTELVYLLTSVLYCIFFLLLWKLYGSSRKARFSGFSHFNQNVSSGVDIIPILVPMNLGGSKVQKILLRFYSISILLITVIIVAFTTPLLVTSWKSTICLDVTNYYMMDDTNLYKAMKVCSYVTVESLEFDCQNTYFAELKPNSSTTPKVYFVNEFYPREYVFWLPHNSTLYGFTNMTSTNVSFILNTTFPCNDIFRDEGSYNLIYLSLKFDCLPNVNRNNFNKYSCKGESCKTFEITYKQSGMINISFSFDTEYMKRGFYINMDVYDSSSLSKKINVLEVTQFSNEHNMILNEVPIGVKEISFAYGRCCITFTCNIQFYYPLATALGVLVTFPIYLFAAVICIHRH